MSDDIKIKDIYNQILQTGENQVERWIRESSKKIQSFAQKVQPISPFLDKPHWSKDSERGKFWIRDDEAREILYMYGIAPNLSRIKGVSVPFDKWHNTHKYNAFFYGEYRTMKKGQTVSNSPGKPFRAEFDSKKVEPSAFFGVKYGNKHAKKMVYGRYNGIAIPLYYTESFADYIYNQYRDDIDRIIIDAGETILSAL